MIYIILIIGCWAITTGLVIARYLNIRWPPKIPDTPVDNPECDILFDEINELHYELDLLKRIADKQDLDTSADWLTASQLKKALQTEKAIHATLKKIRKLESKLEQLD